MLTIYKYPLTPGNPCTVSMPQYAALLHVGAQGDGPVVWAQVDTEQPSEERRFWTFGTGHPITEGANRRYLGTCQTDSGLVWHVYQEPVERNIGEMLLDMAVRETPSR